MQDKVVDFLELTVWRGEYCSRPIVYRKRRNVLGQLVRLMLLMQY